VAVSLHGGVLPDFDENVRQALEDDEAFMGLLQQLKDAATSTVKVRDGNPCPKGCGCKHIRMVEVPDYNTKLKIMEFLANRGVGRPNQAESGSDERVVFERVVYMQETESE
jgi:hypothetical protein